MSTALDVEVVYMACGRVAPVCHAMPPYLRTYWTIDTPSGLELFHAAEQADPSSLSSDDRTAAWLAGRARNFSSLPSSVIDLPGTPEPAYYQEPKSLDEQLFTGTALRSSFELPPPAYPQDETGKSETKKLSVSK